MTTSKVINIKSEILFREAEDYLFYFNKQKRAYKNLEEAISLTPSHIKSIMLKGNIEYMSGNFKKAEQTYLVAYNYSKKNSKILGAISNCCFAQNKFNQAEKYINLAFDYINEETIDLITFLNELKINILIQLKKYEEAKKIAEKLPETSKIEINIINFKIKLREKLKHSQIQLL